MPEDAPSRETMVHDVSNLSSSRQPTSEVAGPRWVGGPWSAWLLGIGAAALVGVVVWLVVSDSRVYRFLLRLYQDREFTRDTLQRWGVLAPVIFMLIQALQVVISPVPGEVTGFLGGFLFGEALGFVYSTIGLTLGSLAAFGAGHWLGAPYVRRLVPAHLWDHMGFLVKAEGAILCFILYLLPGFPKDIVCYLFGLSPMPFWVFGTLSTLGRMPGTWVLSAQGAKTATGQYVEVIILTAVVAAVALPLYYFRKQILAWFRRSGSAR